MGRQATHGLDQREGRDDPVTLCGNQVDTRIQQFLLRIEHRRAVVRWPTRASSRTPVSAVSAAGSTLDLGRPESARMRPPASPRP